MRGRLRAASTDQVAMASANLPKRSVNTTYVNARRTSVLVKWRAHHPNGIVGQFRTADGLVLLSGGDAGTSDVPAAQRFASPLLLASTSQ